jgi:signal transduction histidine kinase
MTPWSTRIAPVDSRRGIGNIATLTKIINIDETSRRNAHTPIEWTAIALALLPTACCVMDETRESAVTVILREIANVAPHNEGRECITHDMTAADELDRLRDELFVVTAHAIKTPVAIIRTAAQVLARIPREFHQSTEILERQSARIHALVENLFALYRIRSGTLQLYLIEVELAPLLQQTAKVRCRHRDRSVVRTRRIVQPAW